MLSRKLAFFHIQIDRGNNGKHRPSTYLVNLLMKNTKVVLSNSWKQLFCLGMEKRNEQEHNLESGETTYGPNHEKRGKRAVFNVQPATRPRDVPVLNVQQCVSPTLTFKNMLYQSIVH